jgi:hypothetical protein
MEQIKNFFKFLEDKEGKNPPLIFKLLYDQESITPEDLDIRGSLDLEHTQEIQLPDNLEIRGDLYLSSRELSSLPDNLYVGGDIYIYYTPLSDKDDGGEIKKMIEDKGGKVKGRIYARYSWNR